MSPPNCCRWPLVPVSFFRLRPSFIAPSQLPPIFLSRKPGYFPAKFDCRLSVLSRIADTCCCKIFLSEISKSVFSASSLPQLDLEGCGFIGLYAGLYGFLCLFCIGMFGSQHEALVKTYILVTSQIVLAIELFISGYNLYQEDCRKYSRNLWSNIRFIFFITLFVVAIVSFDWTYKFFSEFEFPFACFNTFLCFLRVILAVFTLAIFYSSLFFVLLINHKVIIF